MVSCPLFLLCCVPAEMMVAQSLITSTHRVSCVCDKPQPQAFSSSERRCHRADSAPWVTLTFLSPLSSQEVSRVRNSNDKEEEKKLWNRQKKWHKVLNDNYFVCACHTNNEAITTERKNSKVLSEERSNMLRNVSPINLVRMLNASSSGPYDNYPTFNEWLACMCSSWCSRVYRLPCATYGWQVWDKVWSQHGPYIFLLELKLTSVISM